MKHKKMMNVIAVFVLILLLGTGYVFPAIIMAVEDRNLHAAVKSVQIQKIELNFQNVDVVEELAVFSDMVQNNIIIETSETMIMESDLKIQQTEQSDAVLESDSILDMQQSEPEAQNRKYQILKDCMEEFWQTLEIEVEFEKFSAVNYVMMVSKNDERVYSIWKWRGVDNEENEYDFWIDEAAEKVMAFEIPFSILGISDESFYEAMQDVAQYYGFSACDFAEYISNVYKGKYWQNDMILMNEKGEEVIRTHIFKSGYTFSFNVYPGMAEMYYDIEKK